MFQISNKGDLFNKALRIILIDLSFHIVCIVNKLYGILNLQYLHN